MESSVEETNDQLVLEMQLPHPCPEPLSQAPTQMFFQTARGRWQDGYGAADRALCPSAITPVTFKAVAVATCTSARLVSQLKHHGWLWRWIRTSSFSRAVGLMFWFSRTCSELARDALAGSGLPASPRPVTANLSNNLTSHRENQRDESRGSWNSLCG